jgi:hypothetical protein
MPRHSAMAAGEVTDALSNDLADEHFYSRKERIFSHRVCTNPLIVPLGNVIICLHRYCLPSRFCSACIRHRLQHTTFATTFGGNALSAIKQQMRDKTCSAGTDNPKKVA